ncbi:unnamed protein product [Periconia digitata]|uniref:VWFA domain-containing protein n=1 Tax=Periconia digitata TaxID=1303443 RepID=A0A9W4UHG1_9PLEO|nr:unnamed protein product [Periconia digitata]
MSLHTTTFTSYLHNHNHNTPRSRFSSGRNQQTTEMGLTDRLKRSLSRRSSNPPEQKSASSRGSTFLSPQSNNPFTSGSPPTRRPDTNNTASLSSAHDPPPAYTAAQPSASTQYPAAPIVTSTADDAYTFLESFDTIFVIDDSGSMAGRGWRETAEALKLITPICASHDADGIDIYFLNHPDSPFHKNVTSAGTVAEIFQSVRPSGATPTGQKLHKILTPYLRKYQERPDSTKPINVIVITDGVPTDDVESPLVAVAKKLDKLEAPAWQVGVQFFQVGNDREAREHLKKLDDEMREISGVSDLRDMVDTVAFQGDGGAALTHTGVLKVVCGSINRRLDRNSKELHRGGLRGD